MGTPSRRRRKVVGSYELGQRRCPICCCQLVYNFGQPNTATFEHLVPKSAGGTEALINGLVVCSRCNQRRGNTCWLKWIKQSNAPKQEYLSKKYFEALAFYRNTERNVKIRITEKIKIHIENLTINS